MDYLELQRRANVLVNKVNEFEANLQGTEANESEILDQHIYADTACLSPVLRTIFGANVDTKTNRDLTLPTDLWFFSSNSPANITRFTPFGPDYKTTTKEFIQNIDMMNNYNMLQLDVKENTVVNKSDRIKQGINYSQSVHINDAMLIESQVANLFKWNTTSEDDIDNNVIVNNRQVPGIVCYYLGNNYDSSYTATLPQNRTNKLNGLTYSYPTYYGAYYTKDEATSQVGKYPGSECLRMFIPGMFYTGGVLRSPQQIWLPDVKFGNDNIGYGFNWQAQGLYHELVFKNKRKNMYGTGTKEVYDSSKFNIVGSPTITDDGIASGFSTSNYVSVNCNLNNNIELIINFKCKFDTVEQRIWSALGSGSTQHYLTLVQAADNELELRVPDIHNNFYSAVFTYNLKDNEDIWVKLKIKGNTAQGFISANGINWELKGTTTVYENLASLVSGTIYLGALEQYTFAGSTDLKELKITVSDNLEFKGTKTVPGKVKLDFVPGADSVSDNDEQGFATRLALAKQKKYYKNRPWFTELDSLSELDASRLADSIDEKSKNDEGAALTDTEFYTSYKLDYNTFADSYNIK